MPAMTIEKIKNIPRSLFGIMIENCTATIIISCLLIFNYQSSRNYQERLYQGELDAYQYARMFSIESLLEPLHNALSPEEIVTIRREYDVVYFEPERQSINIDWFHLMHYKWAMRSAEKGSICSQSYVDSYKADKHLSNKIGIQYEHKLPSIYLSCKEEKGIRRQNIEEVVCHRTLQPYWCDLAQKEAELDARVEQRKRSGQ